MDTKKLEEAKKKLTQEQYNICFLGGTESPHSGKYTDNFEKGMYECVVCKTPLFSSETKFHSESSWPSFDNVYDNDWVKLENDVSLGMSRVEVICKTCGAHLGHLFNDGPTKTGNRYCINSLALEFKPSQK